MYYNYLKRLGTRQARINKLLIAFVHRITLRKHLYSPGLYAESVCSIVPKLDYIMQFFTIFPAMFSSLGHKHQYSASVCAKFVFPIVPKLDYIIQYFMVFPMMYSKLGHKLTNVETASINKVLIAFVHRITLCKHLYSPGVYAESVRAIIPNLDVAAPKLDYIVQ
jgi:hypothetical protein